MRSTPVANASASAADDDRKPEEGAAPAGESRPGRRVVLYKPDQGRWVRWGITASVVSLWGFGCHGLHDWPSYDWTWWYRTLVPYPGGEGGGLAVGTLAAFLLWLAGSAAAAWGAWAHPRASEFLIETEYELRKVSWPYDPAHGALSPRQEFVGSAIVVIVFMAVLILFLGVADFALYGLFSWLKIGV